MRGRGRERELCYVKMAIKTLAKYLYGKATCHLISVTYIPSLSLFTTQKSIEFS